MRTKHSVLVQKCGGNQIRVARPGTKRPELPVPESTRKKRALEAWRDRIWRTRYKFLALLHPQFRELIRKIVWSMDNARLPQMRGRLLMGLLFAWVAHGTTRKMEDFILAVFRGTIFLMNDRRFLPANLPADLPKLDVLNLLLVYDPACHKNGVTVDQAVEATRFYDFLGSSPEPKPWFSEWMSELEAMRRQTTAELGEGPAMELWGGSGSKSDGGDGGPKEWKANRKTSTKVTYW